MIQCARCGASNQATSKYCLSCGAPLPAAGGAGYAGGAAQPQAPTPPPSPPPAFGAPPAWGAPGFGPPPLAPLPGSNSAYGQPGAPPGYPQPAPPPPLGAPAPDDRFRIGSPDGLNPFGPTMAPGGESGGHLPGYGPGAPPPPPFAPPPAFGPPPAAPPLARHAHDPGMFAPTAPPPTREEYEAQYRAGAPPPSPEPAYSPPQPYALPQPPAPYAPPQPPAAYAPAQPPAAYAAPPAPYAPPQAPPPPLAPLPGAGGAGAPLAYSPQAPLPQQSPNSTFSSPGAGRDPDYVEPGALRALAGFLVSYDQADLGLFWPLYQGQNLVGRKGAAPGLDIEVDHPTTSSRHAVLYASARPARLKVEDNGSTNGTFLGEQRLDRGRRHELRDGDVVRFGAFSAIIKLV